MSCQSPNAYMASRVLPVELRPLAAGVGAVALGAAVLTMWPELQIDVFARGAAWLAGGFSGPALLRDDRGWLLAFADRPVLVTVACSGTDFFLMVAGLLGWRWLGRATHGLVASVAAVALALPIAIAINAVRIVAVAQAHRWVMPRLPEAYAAFAHLLTGAAIFLPALIALNLVLETHVPHRRLPAGRA